MAMGIGRKGHRPSEVTCRIGGDRPGCDFMITKLGERWADPFLAPAQRKEAIRRRARGATLQELARSYNVSRATISRLSAAA